MPKFPSRAKSRQDTRRRKPSRGRHVRVLIVCEGSKTERNYFHDLAAQYRLGDGIVTVVGLGQTPMQVVKEAQRLRRSECRAGVAYDKVFCVFDRDEHAEFEQASTIACESGIELARSWPCFEFWFLLHLCYTRMPFARSGSNSPGDACRNELKRHWPDHWPEYTKNLERLFQLLRDSLDAAKRHAERAARDSAQTEEPNPSTEAHELVAYLQSLGQPR